MTVIIGIINIIIKSHNKEPGQISKTRTGSHGSSEEGTLSKGFVGNEPWLQGLEDLSAGRFKENIIPEGERESERGEQKREAGENAASAGNGKTFVLP